MLAAVTTALILSPLLVFGNFIEYAYFPRECHNETLDLEGSCIDTISANFVASSSLRCLSFANSRISSVEEGSFDGVPNLIYLNLDGNLIPADKLFSFGNISNLTQLNLNDQRTDDDYGKELKVNTVYPKLEILSLRNAKISGISNTVINPFPKLDYLDLSINRLSFFDSKQLGNNALIYLNLDQNQISWISSDKLNNVLALFLNHNSITSVGDGYGLDLRGLSSLQHLSIAHNRINYISEAAFNHTVKLYHLNISNNALSVLSPELFTPLTLLGVLILDNNEFIDMPPIISNIATLSLNRNNIKSLMSSSLDTLPRLRRLSLAGNKISYISPGTFKSQQELEELYLNDNELTHLPRNWSQSLTRLRYLNLSGNKFTSIESVLDLGNAPLKEVHLVGNPIMFINTGMLKTIPQNVTIYLNTTDEHSVDVHIQNSRRYAAPVYEILKENV